MGWTLRERRKGSAQREGEMGMDGEGWRHEQKRQWREVEIEEIERQKGEEEIVTVKGRRERGRGCRKKEKEGGRE